MDIELLIDGEKPEPELGVMSATIREGINQVTSIEILTIAEEELSETDFQGMIDRQATVKLIEPVDGELKVSRFDGVVYEFHQPNSYAVEEGKYSYKFVIKPKVWKLNIGCNARYDEVKMGVSDQNVTCGKQKVASSGAAISCPPERLVR